MDYLNRYKTLFQSKNSNFESLWLEKQRFYTDSDEILLVGKLYVIFIY